MEIRGEVWSSIIGNQLRVSPVLYESLLVKFRLAEKNPDDDPAFKKNIKDLNPEANIFVKNVPHSV